MMSFGHQARPTTRVVGRGQDDAVVLAYTLAGQADRKTAQQACQQLLAGIAGERACGRQAYPVTRVEVWAGPVLLAQAEVWAGPVLLAEADPEAEAWPA